MSLLVATVGVPLPVPVEGGKDTSTPFPCMHRPCGCQTAHQCWTACCCTTPAERIAWAQANGVEIPSYAVLPKSAEPEKPAGSCCCCSKSKPEAPSCCTPAKAGPPPKAKLIVGWMLRKCRGIDYAWAMLAAMLPPAPPVEIVAVPLPPTEFADPLLLTPGLRPPPDGPPPKS